MFRRHCASRWTLAAFVILSGFARPRQNPFPEIGRIHLNDRLAALGQPLIKELSVYALSFSPDGSRLAIQFGEDIDRYVVRVGQVKRQYLLVVSTADPDTTIYWTEPAKLGFARVDQRAEPAWSPDGNVLVFATVLIRVPGGEACRFPGGFRGFLSADRVLVTVASTSTSQTLGVADEQCRLQERWHADHHFAVRVSPNGSRIALLAPHFDHPDVINTSRSDLFILPGLPPLPKAREAVASGQIDLAGARKVRAGGHGIGGSGMVFVDNAVCGAFEVTGIAIRATDGSSLNGRKAKVACWDAQTGRPVRETPPLWSAEDIVISAGGGRVAVSDGGKGSRASRNGPSALPVPQLRGIWELKSGKMLATWSPDPDGSAPDIQPIARRGFAISSDGRILAESGDDSVLLYRLPEPMRH